MRSILYGRLACAADMAEYWARCAEGGWSRVNRLLDQMQACTENTPALVKHLGARQRCHAAWAAMEQRGQACFRNK